MDITSPPPVSECLPVAHSWAVAWTKARAEKALAEYFACRQIPCFLPLVQIRRVYGKHIRHSQLPLFPSYVFFDERAVSRTCVFDSRKVAQILTPPDPLLLQDELANLALALRADKSLRETRFGATGRPVYVARGPLKGLYGEFVRFGPQCRLIIRVGFICRAAELAIDEAFVEPLH